MNTDKKLSVLIGLWVLDKLIILLMLIFMSCNGVTNDCNGNGAGQYEWECECEGAVQSEGIGPDGHTWFHCCNNTQDDCWYRILGND